MNPFSQSSTRYSKVAGRSSRRGGFTVLEVLVALVILLIGGLAIMNLFPPALNVIRGSENRELAMSQVKGTLAKYSADPATIPDAIYDNSVGGTWTDLGDTAVVGTRNRNKSLPFTQADTNSALDHFKHIVGERHKVLQYKDASNVIYNFVLLNYAYSGTPQVRITESVEGVRVNSGGGLDFSDARFASDGAVFTPTINYSYYASYSWSQGGYIQSVTDEPLANGAIPTSVFRTTAIAGPIAMKVFSLKTSSSTIGDAALGYVTLGTDVTAGQEVTVEYDALDWRVIVSDGAPNAGVTRVPLSTLDSTVPVYSMLTSAPDANYNVSAPQKSSWTTPTSPAWINYRTGDVDYSKVVPTVTLPSAPRARISYLTQIKWAQQPSVAARSYYGYDAARALGSFPREQWREFYWQPNDATMYFHSSEAGKTIMVSFTVGTVKVSNQIMTISSKIDAAPATVSASGFVAVGGKVAKLDLLDANGNPTPANALTSVRGVSVRARAAWVQNGNYTQEIAEMYRPLN